MLRTWLKPVKRARSCRPSSDSRTGFVVVYRARADLDVNGDDGTKRHENRRTPPLMGKTPFPLPVRAPPRGRFVPRSPDPKWQLARIPRRLRPRNLRRVVPDLQVLWFTSDREAIGMSHCRKKRPSGIVPRNRRHHDNHNCMHAPREPLQVVWIQRVTGLIAAFLPVRMSAMCHVPFAILASVRC